jgi:hypothetical protein
MATTGNSCFWLADFFKIFSPLARWAKNVNKFMMECKCQPGTSQLALTSLSQSIMANFGFIFLSGFLCSIF